MILAIVGPTGVGKTKLSVALAKKYNAIIVNCDAVQVYKDLNIGSAKPTEQEKAGIPHLLFDYKEIIEDYTVRDYQYDLRKILEDNKNRNIIIVGGTGLYLCAALYNYDFKENEENKNYDNYSNEELYKLAIKKQKDINIHPNNRVRLIRFLNKNINSESEDLRMLYDVKFIGLTTDRKLLYENINQRVEKMINDGLIDEVKKLKKYEDKSRVLNTAIGYKEILLYLNHQISLEDAIDLIKKNSRHYAKRQYTWFNNKMNITWFNVNYDNFAETIQNVEDFL